MRFQWQSGLGKLAFALVAGMIGLSAAAAPAAVAEPDPKDGLKSANNLKQLGLAMHNYHGDTNSFPPAAYSKDGKPHLSWRVALLPYLDEKKLFEQFKLDEPWDSEHNKKLLDKMPKVFAVPGVEMKEKHLTHYRGFVGAGTAFGVEKGVKLTDLTVKDGTSNTIMIVEADEAVPWTKPDELSYDAKKALPKLGGIRKDGFLVVMCDGAFRKISSKSEEKAIRDAITYDDQINIDIGDDGVIKVK